MVETLATIIVYYIYAVIAFILFVFVVGSLMSNDSTPVKEDKKTKQGYTGWKFIVEHENNP